MDPVQQHVDDGCEPAAAADETLHRDRGDADAPEDRQERADRQDQLDRQDRELRGLIVDWGGVLTAPLDDAMVFWARQEQIDFDHFRDVMREWLGPRDPRDEPGYAGSPGLLDEAPEVARVPADSPVHQLERGTITPAEFEHELSRALRRRGSIVPADGLLTRVLSGLRGLSDDMLSMVRRARLAGLRTALLSNSWGDDYPEHAWQGAFDAVVISGRIGMRKPEPEIFRHTADLLGLAPEQCVMVDDLPQNVRGAVAAGMVGVRHRSFEETADELEALFHLTLR